MRDLFNLATAPVLAVLVLLVLAASADAGIFRKRRCNSGGCSAPVARPAVQTSASSVRFAQPASYASSAVQGCPGGRCPIQR